MTIQISTQDARTARAIEVLTTADRWLKIKRKADGQKFYAIPSSTGEHIYWTNLTECSCPDSQHRGIQCKHRIAVALHVAQVNGQPKRRAPKPAVPASEFFTAESIGGSITSGLARARMKANAALYREMYGSDDE